MERQKLTEKETKESLAETSLKWKGSGLYNKDRELYTFKNGYVRGIVRKSIKGRKVCAFNRYFQSKRFDEIMLTIKKHLKTDNKKISTVIDENSENKTKKEEENPTLFEGNENDYRKIEEKEKRFCQ